MRLAQLGEPPALPQDKVECHGLHLASSQLPACEREGLQVSAPGKQLLTKAAAVVIPGAQGPSQPHSQSEAVFYVVVALVRVRGPESFLNGFQRTSERSQATCYMAGITA